VDPESYCLEQTFRVSIVDDHEVGCSKKMTGARIIPTALTIAGSDSGGGAGVQADLNTFAALGVHGTSALTCVTAQNPSRVLGIQPCSEVILRQQIEAVFEEFEPGAVKTGMLFSSALIRVAARCLRNHKRIPIIVDPVMISTSGTRLLKTKAIKTLVDELLPLAALVTPNVPEAELLLHRVLRTPQDLRGAAREIHDSFGCAALVKGGHLRGPREAIDIFYDGKTELLLTAPFVRGIHTHGTGCTYSAAITAYLARGYGLPKAVELAKGFISRAITESRRVGKHTVLNWRAE
jgi:hydroxymethylpyrimidine/phosphomethylpyrimidine kinase